MKTGENRWWRPGAHGIPGDRGHKNRGRGKGLEADTLRRRHGEGFPDLQGRVAIGQIGNQAMMVAAGSIRMQALVQAGEETEKQEAGPHQKERSSLR